VHLSPGFGDTELIMTSPMTNSDDYCWKKSRPPLIYHAYRDSASATISPPGRTTLGALKGYMQTRILGSGLRKIKLF
jgi:hypothetical protein